MTRRIRVFMLLALLLVGGVSLLALPPNEVNWEYYTDSSFSTLCGERILFCGGYTWSWGCRTSYYYTWSYPC